jgi:Sap, sulfolipid-1-addressing protein
VAAGAATVVQAKLTTAGSYLALVLFCLLASSSFLYLELYATFASGRAGARLERMRTWLNDHQDQVVIAICLLLGFWLAGKSIYLLVS